jgi:hypothetical protein
MQSLDIDKPDLPDLQFVLLVTALCTSDLASLNIPEPLRDKILHQCWVLVNDTPVPAKLKERVLDLRFGTETMLEALVVTIRSLLTEAGIRTITWDHPPSPPTQTSTPEALPLIERLQQLYPPPEPSEDPESQEQ